MIYKPIPESYWVFPGQFLAGEYPVRSNNKAVTHERLSAFLNAGFDTFIDLTIENERPPYTSILKNEATYFELEIRHLRFSFPDFSVPSPQMMVAALDAIDAALSESRKVYLHCVGGIGRTGLVVGCYLIRHGMDPADALHHLRELYHTSLQSFIVPETPETDAQAMFIRKWGENGLA
ncbi:MAG: dual specificity protein phosphatase family protein [Anaerolineales bacterium]|jgi:hypothetical protein